MTKDIARDVCAEMRARCEHCGGTGDVHRMDGEWLGFCDCQYGVARRTQGTVSWCDHCNMETTFEHDHKADSSGIDDGPPLVRERRKPEPKSADEMKAIRAAAWATRRAMYGERGHR